MDDDVVLLRIDAPPSQVEARTRTDGYGSFELPIQNQEKPHLLRVLHAGVAYEKRVTGSTTISLDVYEAAGKAAKISGSLEVIRFTTRQTFLHVSDMIDIRNESDPPVTQTGDQTLQVNAHRKQHLTRYWRLVLKGSGGKSLPDLSPGNRAPKR